MSLKKKHRLFFYTRSICAHACTVCKEIRVRVTVSLWCAAFHRNIKEIKFDVETCSNKVYNSSV